jgi:hypothetical protein
VAGVETEAVDVGVGDRGDAVGVIDEEVDRVAVVDGVGVAVRVVDGVSDAVGDED